MVTNDSTKGSGDRLDRAVESIRDESVDAETMRQAADRAWARIDREAHDGVAAMAATGEAGVGEATEASGRMDSCADFRALIPDYVDGRLSGARQTLFEDHVHQCVGCRHALEDARSETALRPRIIPLPERQPETSRLRPVKWAVAAAVVLAVGLIAAAASGLLPLSPAPVLASVEGTDGTLYRVDGDSVGALAVGDSVVAGEQLRTAPGSGAVLRLDDGSMVEISERAALTLGSGRGGETVELERGSLIVQAAEQHDGRLRVTTDDCDVSVKGTVFTVNRGTKGSRVSVLEGEVHVAQGRQNTVLLPGEQLVTSAGIDTVELHEEIAWSSNVDDHLALLEQLAGLEREVAGLMLRGERHESKLLPLVPDETVVYVAMPNVGLAVSEARDLLDQRIAESEVLGQWWESEVAPSDVEPDVDKAFEHLAGLGDVLGDEIVLSMQVDPEGEIATAALLAELVDPEGFAGRLDAMLADVDEGLEGDSSELVMVDDPFALDAAEAGDGNLIPGDGSEQPLLGAGPDGPPALADGPEGPLYVWARDRLLVVTPSASVLREVAETYLGAAAGGSDATSDGFVGSAFHARIAREYGDGVDWLAAVDAAKVIGASALAAQRSADEPNVAGVLEGLGIQDVEHIVLTQERDGDDGARSEASVTFSQARRGLAAWLAEPAPMGALEYVAPDANAMAAFVIDEPSVLLSDLVGLLDIVEPGSADELRSAEAREGIALLDELAGSLGGEIAVALDGPWLPKPGVKLVAEVYDPETLHATVERVVERLNALSAAEDGPQLTLSSEIVGDHTVHSISSDMLPIDLHYLVDDGYLVAGPSRPLLERAIRYHDSGVNLASSPDFLALLPEDGEINFSALAYQNLGGALEQVVGRTGLGASGLSGDQSAALGSVVDGLSSTLAYAYAGDNEIRFASTGPAGFNALGMSLFGLLGGEGHLGPAGALSPAHPGGLEESELELEGELQRLEDWLAEPRDEAEPQDAVEPQDAPGTLNP